MIAWSAWRRLEGLPAMSADVLSETLDGGQAFRWQQLTDPTVFRFGRGAPRARPGADEPRPYENVSIPKDRGYSSAADITRSRLFP